MSKIIQSKTRDSSKRRAWRMINGVLLLVSFFTPWNWESMDGSRNGMHISTGFWTLHFYQYMTNFGAFVQQRELSDRLRIAWGGGQYFIGLYALLIYAALNLFLAAGRPASVNKRVWVPIGLCLLILGVRSLGKIVFLWEEWGWQGLQFTLWGYWMVLIAIASSMLLEISDFLQKESNSH